MIGINEDYDGTEELEPPRDLSTDCMGVHIYTGEGLWKEASSRNQIPLL